MLKTEMRNSYTMNFDKMTSAEMVEAMCRENMNAALAVEAASESIVAAVDIVADAFNNGHKLYLIGCGTGYTKGDISDINVKNISGIYAKSTILSNADVERVTLENITHTDPEKPAILLDYPDGFIVI